MTSLRKGNRDGLLCVPTDVRSESVNIECPYLHGFYNNRFGLSGDPWTPSLPSKGLRNSNNGSYRFEDIKILNFPSSIKTIISQAFAAIYLITSDPYCNENVCFA